MKNIIDILTVKLWKFYTLGRPKKIQCNKARRKPYKALERELTLITAQLLITKPAAPHYDWQDRADLR